MRYFDKNRIFFAGKEKNRLGFDKKKTALQAVELLKKEYPDAICSLVYTVPHELLIATRLAAQCTDARVNIVCKDLFQKYRSIADFAQADLEDIEQMIKSCGLYKTKARDIVNMCKMLHEEYNGIMPETVEELTKLPGIGRKTANLMVGDIFHKPAIVCDTHCIRITNLLGLSEGKDPLKVENQLRPLLPPEESNNFCHRLVLHGRAVCVARKPKCDQCVLNSCCKHALENAQKK
ncbi:MAG: endonuclease III [Oscillospiraceae bacterium]|nr:endonuclease III [Oscillospiraceae bacterium]